MTEKNGKEYYDAIPIPDALEETVARSVRRGKRKVFMERFAGSAAAMLAVVLIAANVPMLYTQASEMPVLGEMVRILRIGSGGTVGTPVSGIPVLLENGVALQFETKKGEAAEVPPFSAIRRTAPERIVLRMHEIKTLDQERLREMLRRQEAVADAYFTAAQDADEVALSILINRGYDCTIGEYGAPSALRMEFTAADVREDEDVWYLRSPSVERAEMLTEMAEALDWEGASQVKTGAGTYFLTLGAYGTLERAEKAAAGIYEVSGIHLEPACGEKYEIPLE